jgi:hypothetical protein
MSKGLFGRIIIAVIFALILSSIGMKGDVKVLQSLYTVLGILYSIAMSLIVSFNLTQIRNIAIKKDLRKALRHIRNTITIDFGISSFALMCGLCMDTSDSSFHIYSYMKIDVLLLAICIVSISIIYDIRNFYAIQKLNDDVVDKVMEEENQ